MADALAAGEVADLAAARSADLCRRELLSRRDQLTATLAGLCGDEQVDQLRSRLEQLCAGQPAELDLVSTDTATARAELDAVEAARIAAEKDCETRRQIAAGAARRLAETSTRATVLQNAAAAEKRRARCGHDSVGL